MTLEVLSMTLEVLSTTLEVLSTTLQVLSTTLKVLSHRGELCPPKNLRLSDSRSRLRRSRHRSLGEHSRLHRFL